jgi:hypothetical protein
MRQARTNHTFCRTTLSPPTTWQKTIAVTADPVEAAVKRPPGELLMWHEMRVIQKPLKLRHAFDFSWSLLRLVFASGRSRRRAPHPRSQSKPRVEIARMSVPGTTR